MIIKNSIILGFFGAFSILLGILRDRLLATYVGVGPALDVYNASFRIPDLVYGILFSFVSAVTVVPFITKAVHDANHHELNRRFNSLFFFFVIILTILSLLTIFILPHIAQYVVPGFDQGQRASFIVFSSMLLLQPFLLGISALISCLSQVKHKFILYSMAPVAYSVSIILSIIFLYPSFGIKGIIWGVLFGAVANLLVQSLSLLHEKMPISFSFFDFALVKEHLRNAIPRSGSIIISRFRDVVFAAFATFFGAGALSIYVFAQRVMDAFIQVVVQSLSTASLPSLAKHHTVGEVKEYNRILYTNIALVFLIACLASAVLLLVPDFIVLVLYGRVAGFEDISRFVALLSISLPLYSINTYFVGAFNANRDGLGLFIANVVATLASLGVLFFLKERGYGLDSLIYSTWTVGVTYLATLIFLYRKKTKSVA